MSTASQLDLDESADFLEEYALRPPRADLHFPPADTKRWREVQVLLRDLARRLRQTSGGEEAAFTESDAQFLGTQSSRLYRMQHWIRNSVSHAPDPRGMADVAGMAAKRLEILAAYVRSRAVRPAR